MELGIQFYPKINWVSRFYPKSGSEFPGSKGKKGQYDEV